MVTNLTIIFILIGIIIYQGLVHLVEYLLCKYSINWNINRLENVSEDILSLGFGIGAKSYIEEETNNIILKYKFYHLKNEKGSNISR